MRAAWDSSCWQRVSDSASSMWPSWCSMAWQWKDREIRRGPCSPDSSPKAAFFLHQISLPVPPFYPSSSDSVFHSVFFPLSLSLSVSVSLFLSVHLYVSLSLCLSSILHAFVSFPLSPLLCLSLILSLSRSHPLHLHLLMA